MHFEVSLSENLAYSSRGVQMHKCRPFHSGLWNEDDDAIHLKIIRSTGLGGQSRFHVFDTVYPTSVFLRLYILIFGSENTVHCRLNLSFPLKNVSKRNAFSVGKSMLGYEASLPLLL